MEHVDWEHMNETYEAGFWGTCTNTASEEHKQYTYARLMGLELVKSSGGGPWYYDLRGRAIVDLGGGPVSMLLKTRNWYGKISVVDPCPYPDWVRARYEAASINWVQEPGETWEPDHFYDEAWIYNVLQHVEDVESVIKTAKRAAKLIRVCEWVCWPPEPGHPHSLSPQMLDDLLGGEGSVALLDSDYEVVGDPDIPPRERQWSAADITRESGPMYFGAFPQ